MTSKDDDMGAAGPSDDDAATVHRLLRRIGLLLGGLLLLFSFWSISMAKIVVLPLVLGVMIALTLSPLVRWISRRGLPRGLTAITLVFAIGIGLAYGLFMLRVPVQMMLDEAPTIQRELRIKLWDVLQNFEQLREASDQLQEMAGSDEGAEDDQTIVVRQGEGWLQTVVSSLAGTGSTVIVALIFAMFLLSSGTMFQRRLVESLDDFRNKRRALRISRDVERQISRYLAAITVINMGLGLAVGVTMHLIGMPYGLFWGVAAFLLNYLPYLGAMLGVVICGAVALVTFDTLGQALLAPGIYLVLTSIEGQMVTPVMVGRHLRLNAASVFVAVVFWAWLWGVAGALMAVPVLVFLKVLCDNIPELRVIGRFLDGEAPPVPSTGRRRRRTGYHARLAAASRALNLAANTPPATPQPPHSRSGGTHRGAGPTVAPEPAKGPGKV